MADDSEMAILKEFGLEGILGDDGNDAFDLGSDLDIDFGTDDDLPIDSPAAKTGGGSAGSSHSPDDNMLDISGLSGVLGDLGLGLDSPKPAAPAPKQSAPQSTEPPASGGDPLGNLLDDSTDFGGSDMDVEELLGVKTDLSAGVVQSPVDAAELPTLPRASPSPKPTQKTATATASPARTAAGGRKAAAPRRAAQKQTTSTATSKPAASASKRTTSTSSASPVRKTAAQKPTEKKTRRRKKRQPDPREADVGGDADADGAPPLHERMFAGGTRKRGVLGDVSNVKTKGARNRGRKKKTASRSAKPSVAPAMFQSPAGPVMLVGEEAKAQAEEDEEDEQVRAATQRAVRRLRQQRSKGVAEASPDDELFLPEDQQAQDAADLSEARKQTRFSHSGGRDERGRTRDERARDTFTKRMYLYRKKHGTHQRNPVRPQSNRILGIRSTPTEDHPVPRSKRAAHSVGYDPPPSNDFHGRLYASFMDKTSHRGRRSRRTGGPRGGSRHANQIVKFRKPDPGDVELFVSPLVHLNTRAIQYSARAHRQGKLRSLQRQAAERAQIAQEHRLRNSSKLTSMSLRYARRRLQRIVQQVFRDLMWEQWVLQRVGEWAVVSVWQHWCSQIQPEGWAGLAQAQGGYVVNSGYITRPATLLTSFQLEDNEGHRSDALPKLHPSRKAMPEIAYDAQLSYGLAVKVLQRLGFLKAIPVPDEMWELADRLEEVVAAETERVATAVREAGKEGVSPLAWIPWDRFVAMRREEAREEQAVWPGLNVPMEPAEGDSDDEGKRNSSTQPQTDARRNGQGIADEPVRPDIRSCSRTVMDPELATQLLSFLDPQQSGVITLRTLAVFVDEVLKFFTRTCNMTAEQPHHTMSNAPLHVWTQDPLSTADAIEGRKPERYQFAQLPHHIPNQYQYPSSAAESAQLRGVLSVDSALHGRRGGSLDRRRKAGELVSPEALAFQAEFASATPLVDRDDTVLNNATPYKLAMQRRREVITADGLDHQSRGGGGAAGLTPSLARRSALNVFEQDSSDDDENPRDRAAHPAQGTPGPSGLPAQDGQGQEVPAEEACLYFLRSRDNPLRYIAPLMEKIRLNRLGYRLRHAPKPQRQFIMTVVNSNANCKAEAARLAAQAAEVDLSPQIKPKEAENEAIEFVVRRARALIRKHRGNHPTAGALTADSERKEGAESTAVTLAAGASSGSNVDPHQAAEDEDSEEIPKWLVLSMYSALHGAQHPQELPVRLMYLFFIASRAVSDPEAMQHDAVDQLATSLVTYLQLHRPQVLVSVSTGGSLDSMVKELFLSMLLPSEQDVSLGAALQSLHTQGGVERSMGGRHKVTVPVVPAVVHRLYKRSKDFRIRMHRERQRKEEHELEQCTFAPKLFSPPAHLQRAGYTTQGGVVYNYDGDEDEGKSDGERALVRRSAGTQRYELLFRQHAAKLARRKKAAESKTEAEAGEGMGECTFKPRINKSHRSFLHNQATEQQNGQFGLPNGYQAMVARMRSHYRYRKNRANEVFMHKSRFTHASDGSGFAAPVERKIRAAPGESGVSAGGRPRSVMTPVAVSETIRDTDYDVHFADGFTGQPDGNSGDDDDPSTWSVAKRQRLLFSAAKEIDSAAHVEDENASARSASKPSSSSSSRALLRRSPQPTPHIDEPGHSLPATNTAYEDRLAWELKQAELLHRRALRRQRQRKDQLNTPGPSSRSRMSGGGDGGGDGVRRAAVPNSARVVASRSSVDRASQQARSVASAIVEGTRSAAPPATRTRQRTPQQAAKDATPSRSRQPARNERLRRAEDTPRTPSSAGGGRSPAQDSVTVTGSSMGTSQKQATRGPSSPSDVQSSGGSADQSPVTQQPVAEQKQRSPSKRTSNKSKQSAVLHVDVLLGPGKSARITVRDGDSYRSLAEQFAKDHELVPEYIPWLEKTIADQVKVAQQKKKDK